MTKIVTFISRVSSYATVTTNIFNIFNGSNSIIEKREEVIAFIRRTVYYFMVRIPKKVGLYNTKCLKLSRPIIGILIIIKDRDLVKQTILC